MQFEQGNSSRKGDLAALANTLKQLRDDAVKGRADSGIEAEWLEDEEYCDGIDDANRSERYIKPTSPDGRVRIEKKSGKKSSKSSVFVNITRPYVNAAAAKLADMRFPTDDNNYAMMRPTPMPDLIQRENDLSPVVDPATGQPMMQGVTDDQGQPVMQQAPNGQPAMQMGQNGQPTPVPAQKPVTQADLAAKEKEAADDACEKANDQINDWLVECQYADQGRQVMEDAARIGTGVFKGPFPENIRKRAVTKALEGIGMVIKDELVPKVKCIPVWNLYPDPSCGESIHNGKYIFEYDQMNGRQLQGLTRDPSYLADVIEEIIEEGPKSQESGESKRPNDKKPNDKELYDVWYYVGYLSRKDLETAGYEFEQEEEEYPEAGLIDAQPSGEFEDAGISEPDPLSAGENDLLVGQSEDLLECGCDEGDDKTQYPAIVVMVNNKVIKATMQPLDSGEFPYDVMVWQRRSGHWAGVGVARQMRTEQDGVNAATRNMMDNAGVSGSPILIINRGLIEPAGGVWSVKEKVYYTTAQGEVDDVRKAFTWVIAPSMQQELMNIVQFWIQRAENAVGLPMILQGQIGQSTPDTYKGQLLTNNNGNTVLRRILRNYEKAAKAIIGRFYEWILIHGQDDSMKGDFTVEVRDSSALIERDSQSQILMQMLGASLNPMYELDPALVMQEFLKAQRFDADKLIMSEEKKQMLQQQAQAAAGGQDPRLQIAQMNNELKAQEIQARSQESQMRMQAEQQLEMERMRFEGQQADMERALTQWQKNVDAQLLASQLSSEQTINMDSLKVALAKESAKLRVQMQLAGKQTTPQVATPSFEPAGKAKPGAAFYE